MMNVHQRRSASAVSSLLLLLLIHSTNAFSIAPISSLHINVPWFHSRGSSVTVSRFASSRVAAAASPSRSLQTKRIYSSTSDTPPSSSSPSSSSSSSSSSSPGDKIRESNGKRPSLNPTIINTISEALLLRSNPPTSSSSSSSPPQPMEISPTTTAIEVAIAAGKLSTKAIDARASTANAVTNDDPATNAFTQEESQLVAGRVIGVVMRFQLLEDLLIERVGNVSWVEKYNEEGSFGLLPDELTELMVINDDADDDDGGAILRRREPIVDDALRNDPLLRMCRAECLYALFLVMVEGPAMEKMGQASAVPGGSVVDFLDVDRMEVLGLQ